MAEFQDACINSEVLSTAVEPVMVVRIFKRELKFPRKLIKLSDGYHIQAAASSVLFVRVLICPKIDTKPVKVRKDPLANTPSYH